MEIKKKSEGTVVNNNSTMQKKKTDKYKAKTDASAKERSNAVEGFASQQGPNSGAQNSGYQTGQTGSKNVPFSDFVENNAGLNSLRQSVKGLTDPSRPGAAQWLSNTLMDTIGPKDTAETPTTLADVQKYRENVKYGTPGEAQTELDAGATLFDNLGTTSKSIGDTGVTQFTDDRTGENIFSNTASNYDEASMEQQGGAVNTMASEDVIRGGFSNMSDLDMERANNMYDLYHDDQMKQVAANDRGSTEHLMGIQAKKELGSIDKQRKLLIMQRKTGKIGSKYFTQGMAKLGALASEANSRMQTRGLLADAASENAGSNRMNAETGRQQHLEGVRANAAAAEAGNVKWLAERKDQNRNKALDRDTKLVEAGLGAYGKTAEYGDTLDGILAQARGLRIEPDKKLGE